MRSSARALCLLAVAGIAFAQFPPNRKKQTRRSNMNLATQIEQLESFILHPNPFNGLDIPKGLGHDTVARFVAERINRDTPFPSLVRVEKVVAFYDLHEVCPHLIALVPSVPAVAARAVLVRTVAAHGLAAEAQKAASLAGGLIAEAKSSAELAEMVELCDRLGPGNATAELAARINAVRASAAGPESTRLGELLSLRVPRVQAANGIKTQVLAIGDRGKRILEELKMYLTLDYGYLEYLTPWAVSRLRRETWAPAPPQQIARRDDAALRTEVAQIFLDTARNLDRMPGVLPENRPSLRVRCLRGAGFFGHTLSSEDRAFIDKHAAGQADMLSNE